MKNPAERQAAFPSQIAIEGKVQAWREKPEKKLLKED